MKTPESFRPKCLGKNWAYASLSARLIGRVAVISMLLAIASKASAQTNNTYQQDDANGYTGVLDTRIVSTSTTPQPDQAAISIDGGADTFMDASWSQGLFHFDNLFGAGPNQIPLNATITSATLTFTTGTGSNDQSNNLYGIYRLNTGFDANSTWENSFGGDGIQVGLETGAVSDIRGGFAQGSSAPFGVIDSLNYWKSQANPNTANTGWVISTIAGTDAWSFASSDNATTTSRPQLSVTYVVADAITWNTTDGTWDSGNGANQIWKNDTTTLATSFIDFSNNVTFGQNANSHVNVTINGSANPGTMTTTHTSGTYEFTGGSISGLLSKTGGGTIIFNNANNFTGATLSGGVVELNAADALGTTGVVSLSGGVVYRPTVSSFTQVAQSFDFSGAATIDVGTGNTYQIQGITSGAGALTKTGAGILEFRGFSAFTGTLDIQGGKVQLVDPAGVAGDLNVSQITVQNGATFQFGGSAPTAEENPDLPGNTNITVNGGGTATIKVGESWGSLTLNGGAFDNVLVKVVPTDPDPSSSVGDAVTPSNLMSGTMTGTFPFNIAAAHTMNKTTPGTVTVTSLPIGITGSLNLQQGVFSTDAPLTGNGPLTIGSATENATLQLRHTAPTTYSKSFMVGDGGATIDVSEPSGDITWSGTIGGTAGTLSKAGPGQLTLTGLHTTTGPVKVAAGVLNVSAINNGGQAGPLGASTNSTANLVLDGGTLRYSGITTTSDRGFSLGSSGGTIDVPTAGTRLTLTGGSAGAGGLTKTGPGILVVTGTNQYAGPTSVSQGTLSVAPFAASGGFTVADGATLGVQVPTLSSSLSMPTLSMGAGGSTLNFEIQTSGLPTSSLVDVTTPNGVNLNGGTQTINVLTTTPLTVGTYKLIDYSGTAITSGFNLGSVAGRATSSLDYNATDTRIDLIVTSTDSIRWKGSNPNGDWDVGSAADVGGTNNWILNSNSSATNFIAGDIVTFDDTASSFNVNITADVNPAIATVNNSASNPYTFQGSGKITGAGSLVKSGDGRLTLETNNDYTGTTTINAGTLQLGNGGTNGWVGTGELTNNGTLTVNRSDDLTLNMPVTGSGALVKQSTNTLTVPATYAATGNITVDAGTIDLPAADPRTVVANIDGAGAITKSGTAPLTLTGNNTHTGGTNVTSGTLIAANTTGSATGTGTTTLSTGTTLQIGNGATAGSVGGTINSGVSGSTGTIVINRSDDFLIPANITGAGPITKNGAGTSTLTGDLSFSGTATVNTAILNLTGNLSYTGNTTISGGRLIVAPTNNFTYTGTTAIGANTLEFNSATGTTTAINGPMTGTGNIVKNGPGTVAQNSDSTFNGTLTINAGTYSLQDNDGSDRTQGDINATRIVVNNSGTFQFGSGQSLSGENPDLPNTTLIDLNAGGTVRWYIGENFGAVNMYGGALILNSNNTFEGAAADWQTGTVTGIASTRTINGAATINKTTNGIVTLVDTNIANTGSLHIQNGTLSTNAGITTTGALTFGAIDGTTAGRLTLTASGSGTTSFAKAATINAGGAIVNISNANRTYNFTGQASGPGGLTKEGPGRLTLSAANSYAGTTSVNAGVLLVNNTHTGGGAYSVASGATLAGTGTINSTVNVSTGGILNPGLTTTVGTLTTTNTLLGGKLQVEYSGTTNLIDKLAVTGLLNLAGSTVDFDLLAGASALSGAGPYVFATYGTLSGTFGSILDLPAGYSINYNYLGNKQIALVPGPVLNAGDFDADGDVDGADFIAWQTNFPTTSGAPRTNGDNDGDGDVDGADFGAWQSSFPHTPGPGSSPVPEPAGLSLALVACLGGWKLFRARKQK